MKYFLTLILIVVMGCSGKEGGTGPAGKDGNPGEQGIPGPQGPSGENAINYQYDFLQVSSTNEGQTNEDTIIEYSLVNKTLTGQVLNLPIQFELIQNENVEVVSGTCLNTGTIALNQSCSLFLKIHESSPKKILVFIKTMVNNKEKYTSLNFNIKNPIIMDLKGGNESLCKLQNNKVYCIGRNDYYQVGNNLSGYINEFFEVPIQNVQKIEYLDEMFCAIDGLKDLYCWGNFKGLATLPTKLNLNNVDQVSGNYTGICAISMGKAYCFTNNLTNSQEQPLIGEDLVQISVGANHKCIKSITDKTYCWGSGGGGQLGNGENNNYSTPQRVRFSYGPFLSGVTELITKNNYTCTREVSGQNIYCWGTPPNNLFSSVVSSSSAVALNVPLFYPTDKITKLFYSGYQISLIKENGAVFSRGVNTYGQLGFISAAPNFNAVEFQPVHLLSEENIKFIVYGTYFGCGIDSEDKLTCWGQTPW